MNGLMTYELSCRKFVRMYEVENGNGTKSYQKIKMNKILNMSFVVTSYS